MFDIQTPGETEYLGSGRVEGQLHNQFSLSENDGYLRVATTSNMWARWWLEDPPESENHLFVLDLIDGVLDEVGHVGGIAAGERIFAARMVGDRGYMVTFEQVDPLFTLDLSDPYDPRVVGELEIPGFSTYIHPIANDKLLTIGVGGDENGANWRTQISMFDVADFATDVQHWNEVFDRAFKIDIDLHRISIARFILQLCELRLQFVQIDLLVVNARDAFTVNLYLEDESRIWRSRNPRLFQLGHGHRSLCLSNRTFLHRDSLCLLC